MSRAPQPAIAQDWHLKAARRDEVALRDDVAADADEGREVSQDPSPLTARKNFSNSGKNTAHTSM
jgi:hypothetical protein